MRTSPRCYANLAEMLCEPRRETRPTSPRCYANLAEMLCEPRRDAMRAAISRRACSESHAESRVGVLEPEEEAASPSFSFPEPSLNLP